MKKRDWKKVKLGDLMLKRNKSVNPAKFKEEFFELYSIPAYSTEQAEIIQGSSIGSSKKTVEEDDVLLSRIVPHIQRCWIVPEKKELRQIASGEWIVFRSEKVLSNYLRFFLLSKPFHKRFMGTVRGVGGSLMRADPKQVADFQIPLPPLPEQKAIAAQLDRADKVRQALAQSLKDYDRLLAASFLDMFGDPVLNPKGWEVVKLGELCEVVSGATPKRNNSEYWDNGTIPWVTPKDLGKLSSCFLDVVPEHITEAGYSSCSTTLLPVNSLLYSSRAPIGYMAINKEPVCTNQGFKSFIPSLNLDVAYLYYAMFFAKKQVEALGTGSTFKEVSKRVISDFKVPLPPLPLQQQFAQLVERIEQQKALIQSAQQSAEDLFGALLQAYFYEGK